jgi:hypothetical protein
MSVSPPSYLSLARINFASVSVAFPDFRTTNWIGVLRVRAIPVIVLPFLFFQKKKVFNKEYELEKKKKKLYSVVP